MNRAVSREVNILDSFLRENIFQFIMYIGIMFIFPAIFYLYNIRTDAVKYAFLLSSVWFLGWETVRFFGYKRRHEDLLEVEKKASAELYTLPKTSSVIEKDYQRILKTIYYDKVKLETGDREFRKETAEYYGMWAHQIKTPIAALKILLQSYALSDQASQFCGSEAAADTCTQPQKDRSFAFVREMKSEVFKIEQYVEMVLTYLRTADMTADFVFGTYELDDIIRRAVKKYSQIFILKKIKLNYEPVGETVLTDEKWLAFVIEQLLSNALKYTREGSISIYTQKILEEECLVIEDTGIGIWAEDLPRVFEKGFTGYNGRENRKSTGIGLYLCKTIMDKLRHGIWLESEVGKGTKAHIRLGRKE